MSDQELKFPQWQIPLQQAILEFDPDQVREKIQLVETLIFERLEQLPTAGAAFAERDAICDALSILRAIKRERLGRGVGSSI